MASIHQTLEDSSATGNAFIAEATKLLTAAGLTLPDVAEQKLLLTRIAAQRPETTWLEVGETLGEGVETQRPAGRRSTAVTCFYDRTKLAVVEHHVRGVEGDYDHTSWANAKRFPTAAKADVAWARLAKKYKFATTVAPAPTAKPKVSAAVTGEPALLAAWWNKPDDTATLQVLADLWVDHADPRGELVQLSLVVKPTADQKARREALIKKHGGALVGPARPFLREWELGANGIVEVARCEADKLVEGIAEISRIHPRLSLCVTSLKKQSTIAAVAKISLAPIYYVGFTMGLIGSQGGTNLTDKALVGIAPAFRGVKRFGLQARGFEGDCFTPSGLRTFADALDDDVELVVFDFYTTDSPAKPALPPLALYIDVFETHRAFKKAKIVTDFDQVRRQLGLRAY